MNSLGLTAVTLTIAALACFLTAPDTTTLVTLEVQSPGGNDSVSLVQVRSRMSSNLLLNSRSGDVNIRTGWQFHYVSLYRMNGMI